MNRKDIFDAIDTERTYQDGKFGTAFDDANTVNDWGTFIGVYLARGTSMQATPSEQRAALLKVATLSVAALETFDRNSKFAPRHYDKV